ncbi:hypothetical protein CN354_01445 [Bacillus cereus]|nr:hypothetical protein CN354_01445 [Bacillus cereus]
MLQKTIKTNNFLPKAHGIFVQEVFVSVNLMAMWRYPNPINLTKKDVISVLMSIFNDKGREVK